MRYKAWKFTAGISSIKVTVHKLKNKFFSITYIFTYTLLLFLFICINDILYILYKIINALIQN